MLSRLFGYRKWPLPLLGSKVLGGITEVLQLSLQAGNLGLLRLEASCRIRNWGNWENSRLAQEMMLVGDTEAIG